MSDPVARAGADLRLIRATVFTAVCVLLSAGGHVLASCASVPVWTLGAGFALVLAAVLPLAGRERSLPGIAAFLAVGQLALHTLFGLGQRGAGTSGRAVPSEGHLVHFAGQLICDQRPMSATEARRVITDAGLDPAVHPMGPAAPAPGGASAPFPHALLPSLPMVLGHLLAALALGWLLRRGEAALWRLVRLSARSARDVVEATLVRALGAALVLVGLRAPESPAVPRRRAGADDERPLRAPALRHSVIRRGPPRCVLAA
ncbi:hypothetical protein [Streptomyces griseocarneus]|uniref:hypothetical protein n=1 Tax=Streptomyces griseocarneus TaxID=51201 RepID=UPI00167D8AAF|nr:hypothetical protein [Streptomyces griseocarneus]MBZ6473074.1 hypothetical protein [Streptomyces griseocarneus]GHG59717.1 hypothetical protein GCM10018779_26350 [Streptomyces griseocarneus]